MDDAAHRRSQIKTAQRPGAGRRRRGRRPALLSHGYFAKPPPKSLDRNTFSTDLIDGLSIEDGAATLAAFTAQAIAKSREHMPQEPELWIVAGGGRRNRTIMRMLAERVHHAVVPAEAAGLDGDSLEAEAWAYLAVRSVKGLADHVSRHDRRSRADDRRIARRPDRRRADESHD